jgi:hypothetical protein
MTRTAVILIGLLGLGSGCATRRNKLLVGGASTIVAGVATYKHATMDDPPVMLTALAITAGMFGLATLLSGLDDEGAPPPQATRSAPLVDNREEAWSHTKVAAAAARAGDCEMVAKLDVVVQQLEPVFHAAVFLGDVAIVRCLAAQRAEPDPPQG